MTASSKPPFAGEVRRVRLGELLADSFSGEWGSEDGEGVTAILRTANFTPDGSLDYSSPAYRCVPSKKVEMKALKRGDILIEKSGGTPKRPVGIVALFDSDMRAVCSNFNHVLRFDSRMIDPRFAFHQLRWLHTKGAFERYTRKTTGLQNLELRKFFDLPLTVPEPGIQRFCVNGFNLIEEIKKTGLRQLSLLDELVKSRFVELFGDPAENPMGFRRETLATLGDLKNGVNYRKGESGCTVLCLGVSDFGNRSELRGVSGLSPISLSSRPSEESFLKDGDLVFVRSNGNRKLVGRCMAVYPQGDDVIYSGFCIRFRLTSDNVRIPYLVWALKQPSMRELLLGRGANVQNLSQRALSDVMVPIPSLCMQDAFVAFAAEVAKSQVVVKKQIDKLQTLYDSLSQRYFA